MMSDEYTTCQWCGEQVLESQIENHWNKKKCTEKGIEEIMISLKQSKEFDMPAKINETSFITGSQPKYNNSFCKFCFRVFKHPAKKVVWVWLSEIALEKEKEMFRTKVKQFEKDGYEIQWANGLSGK